jgi:hypothetical protein
MTVVAISVHMVEETVRALVHSERTTSAKLAAR